MHPAKPRLLVILGAGSSIPCGMPSVGTINWLMRSWGKEWWLSVPSVQYAGLSVPSVNYGSDVFNSLWEISDRYFRTNHYGIRPNYERVLGEMTALASWLTPPPFGNPTMDAFDGCRPLGALAWIRDSADEFAGRKLVLSQQEFLFERLANHMREHCRQCISRSTDLVGYSRFYRLLREHFDVGIYNLNYDTVARSAWPEAFNGFDKWGYFDPLVVMQRQEWGSSIISMAACITAFPMK